MVTTQGKVREPVISIQIKEAITRLDPASVQSAQWKENKEKESHPPLHAEKPSQAAELLHWNVMAKDGKWEWKRLINAVLGLTEHGCLC